MKCKKATKEFVPKALRELIRRAQAESRALGFTTTQPTKPAMVAEAKTKYRTKR